MITWLILSVELLEYWKMDKVQKNSNFKCYAHIPLSEPFRFYWGLLRTQKTYFLLHMRVNFEPYGYPLVLAQLDPSH
jgi:hypothetical protein